VKKTWLRTHVTGANFSQKTWNTKLTKTKIIYSTNAPFVGDTTTITKTNINVKRKMATKIDSDEFIARLKKIISKLPCHVDVQIHLQGDFPGDKKAPYIEFIETAYETCVLFNVSITMTRFLEMDDEHFDQIFQIEFGKEVKEYKPWDSI
jgi:hypothetical protein